VWIRINYMIEVTSYRLQTEKAPRCSRSARLGRRPQSAATNFHHPPHLSSCHCLSEPPPTHENGGGEAFEVGLLLGSARAVFCA
jgi:hypothetical protein